MADLRLTAACEQGLHRDNPRGCKGFTYADPGQPRKSETVKCECSCHEARVLTPASVHVASYRLPEWRNLVPEEAPDG